MPHSASSDEEASLSSGYSLRSSTSQLSTRTEDGVGSFRNLTPNLCGAKFQVAAKPNVLFVCFALKPCRRPHHKQLAKAVSGTYFEIQRTAKGSYDGVLNTAILAEDYLQVAQKHKDDTKAAIAAAGANSPWQNTIEQKFQSNSKTPVQPVLKTPPMSKPEAATHKASLPFESQQEPSASVPKAQRQAARFVHTEEPTVRFSDSKGSPSSQTTTAQSTSSGSPNSDDAVHQLTQMVAQLAAQVEGMRQGQQTDPPKASSSNRKKSKKKPKKGRKQSSRGRKSSRRRTPDPDSSDSSSSSGTSSSESNESSTESDPSKSRKKWWYAVIHGRNGASGVFASKSQARRLCVKRSIYRRFADQAEAWRFVESHLKEGSLEPEPQRTPGEGGQPPSAPPISLSGRDKSINKEDEVFGISLDTDTKDLRQQLSPPGIDQQVARDLGEAMLDAVSLPGKTAQSTEADDMAANIQASLSELAAIQRQECLDDDIRRDLKWSNASRNALRGVRTESDLRELLKDVLSLQSGAIRNVITAQRTVLMRQPWSKEIVDAWSYGGYISCISRLSLSHYIDLLQHLVQVTMESSWLIAKKEIDYYVKRMVLIRNNSQSRLVALCRIYILLRDSAEASWRSNKLEAEKMVDLYQMMESFSGGGAPRMKDELKVGTNSSVCSRCSTSLHGAAPCPWSHLGVTKAKKAGRDALKNLALGKAINLGGKEGKDGDGNESGG